MIGWSNPLGDIFVARTRHLAAIQLTVKHIDNGFLYWESLELLAEELRCAHNALSAICGTFSNNDLLGEIFSKFCFGMCIRGN
jgi:tRNA modification GTPase